MSEISSLEPVELTDAEIEMVSGGVSLQSLFHLNLHNLNNVLNNSFNNLLAGATINILSNDTFMIV